MTDHHDMAGLPGNFKGIQTMLGLEYRPTFWINLFNRLRYLEFEENGAAPNDVQDLQVSKLKRQPSSMSEWLESLKDCDSNDEEA
jgi:hypothetical protein